MKITAEIEARIKEQAEKEFISRVVNRIVDKAFNDSKDRIEHYVAEQAANLGDGVKEDMPM